MNTNFTLLTKDQVFGENRLDIFKKGTPIATASDFTNLLGACSNGMHCEWATQSLCKMMYGPPNIYSCAYSGKLTYHYMNKSDEGVRPAIKYSDIAIQSVNETVNSSGIKVVEYGEYPQTVVDDELSKELNLNYIDSTLVPTTKSYTMPDEEIDDVNYFSSEKLMEYEYKGEKYVRFVVSCNNTNGYTYIHNGKDMIKLGLGSNVFWIKVEPIKWLVDEVNNIALSEKVLLTGIKFYLDDDKTYTFDKSNIKRFLDEYFSREILTPELMKADSKSIEEILNELEPLRNEMLELTNNKKVKRYIELVSEIITLTEQLRSAYSGEEVEKEKIKKRINDDILFSNYPGDTVCF